MHNDDHTETLERSEADIRKELEEEGLELTFGGCPACVFFAWPRKSWCHTDHACGDDNQGWQPKV
jgi:hypothetical protein